MAKQLVIDDSDVGRRFDVVAASMLPNLSRAYVQRLLDEGHIKLNDELAKPGQKLRHGDTVLVDFDQDELARIEPIDLPIIFEDDNVIVIDKPVGVISHSRGRYWYESSVASFIRDHTGQEGDRAGIVHRLDRATSGVMICAKNHATLSWLQKQFSVRKVTKTYLAIVAGHIQPTEAIIDMPIERNPSRPQTFRVGNQGKAATTHYKVEESFGAYDKVVLKPETGRTHQLRVHMKQLGHPIVGDTLYEGANAERLFLHAASLEITLPDKQRVTFKASEPVAFKEFIRNHG